MGAYGDNMQTKLAGFVSQYIPAFAGMTGARFHLCIASVDSRFRGNDRGALSFVYCVSGFPLSRE